MEVPGPTTIVVMGVSGSGKTTIADALALRVNWDFEDGDIFHPASNVAKMRVGQPLTRRRGRCSRRRRTPDC